MTTKVSLGTSKSLLVQFPFELRDVLVSDPEKLDAVVQSSNRVFLIAKKVGQTNAFFFDAHGKQILTLEVSVGADLSALDDLVRRFVPGSSVKSEMAGNAIVLTGVVRTPVDAARAGDLAFQFAQANRNAISSSFSSASKGGGDCGNDHSVPGRPRPTGDLQQEKRSRHQSARHRGRGAGDAEGDGRRGAALDPQAIRHQSWRCDPIGQFLDCNSDRERASAHRGCRPRQAADPRPRNGGSGSRQRRLVRNNGHALQLQSRARGQTFGNSGVTNGYSWRNGSVTSALRAMERDGLVRTLAEPNLTAVSGETAKFLAGGEFPIPLVDSTGKMSVTFKEFGVGLAFTPVVMSEGRISLKIETEVSELTDVGAVTLSDIRIPALKKRQAKSTVELPSGGSLALAGMISEDTRQNIDGFPGLKDVPVIGTLFRSRDFSKNETELVVIVTPYVVRPTSRKNLARPDDGLAAATDRKANFLGHINRVYGRGRELPPGALRGEYGFIVE